MTDAKTEPLPMSEEEIGELERKIAHIICQHMEADGPCLGCSLDDKGQRGGVRGCILAATKAAREVLALPRLEGRLALLLNLRVGLEDIRDRNKTWAGAAWAYNSAGHKALELLQLLEPEQEGSGLSSPEPRSGDTPIPNREGEKG